MTNLQTYISKIKEGVKKKEEERAQLAAAREKLEIRLEQALRILSNIEQLKCSNDFENCRLAWGEKKYERITDDPVYLKLRLFEINTAPPHPDLNEDDKWNILKKAKEQDILPESSTYGIMVEGLNYRYNEVLVEKKIHPLLRKLENRTMTEEEYNYIRDTKVEQLALLWDSEFPSRWYYCGKIHVRGGFRGRPIITPRLPLVERLSANNYKRELAIVQRIWEKAEERNARFMAELKIEE